MKIARKELVKVTGLGPALIMMAIFSVDASSTTMTSTAQAAVLCSTTARTVCAMQDASLRAGTITETFEKEDEVVTVWTDFSTPVWREQASLSKTGDPIAFSHLRIAP